VTFKGIVGFPDRLRTNLRYSTVIPVPAVAHYEYVFKANSLFDPDLTGVGHQPTYFDQLAAIYSQYCVLGCKA